MKIFKYIRIFLLFSFLLLYKLTFAQYFPTETFTQNKSAMSPAFAGFNGNVESFVSFSKQWTGISGAPHLTALTISSPIFYESGLLFSISEFQTGNFSYLNFDVAFAQHFKIGKDFRFSLAIRPELYRNQLELSQIKSQGTDPALNDVSSLRTSFLDIGGGAVFAYKSMIYGGFSMRALAESAGTYKPSALEYLNLKTLDFNLNFRYAIDKNYETEAGYYIAYHPDYYRKYVQQIWLNGAYKRKLTASVIFRTPATFAFTAGGIISDNILLTYNYGFSFAGIQAASGGNHTVGLSFLIKRNTINQLTDIFPVSEQQQEIIENDQEMKELQAELYRTRQHLNRVVSHYDRRFSELEDEKQIEDRTAYGNRKDLKFSSPETLQTIAFSEGTNKLLSCSKSDIYMLVNRMMKDSDLLLKITVSVPNSGSERISFDLARKRANVIRKELTDKGVNPKRVFTEVSISDKNTVFLQFAK